MFEVAEQMLIQLIGLMPYIFGLLLVFEFIGSLLFKRW